MKIKAFVIGIILLLVSSVSYGKPIIPGEWVKEDVAEYKGATGLSVTVAWDDQPYDTTTGLGWCPLATFQIKIYNEERGIWLAIENNIPRDKFEWMYSFPKSGHWISFIRARQKCELPYRDPSSATCINHTESDREEGYEYSDWASSEDPAHSTVDGVARGWKHFTWIGGPGPIMKSFSPR